MSSPSPAAPVTSSSSSPASARADPIGTATASSSGSNTRPLRSGRLLFLDPPPSATVALALSPSCDSLTLGSPNASPPPTTTARGYGGRSGGCCGGGGCGMGASGGSPSTTSIHTGVLLTATHKRELAEGEAPLSLAPASPRLDGTEGNPAPGVIEGDTTGIPNAADSSSLDPENTSCLSVVTGAPQHRVPQSPMLRDASSNPEPSGPKELEGEPGDRPAQVPHSPEGEVADHEANKEHDYDHEQVDVEEGDDDNDDDRGEGSSVDEATQELRQEQAKLRKAIIAIQQNEAYSSAEKAKLIQGLISRNWSSRQRSTEQAQHARALNKLEHKNSNFDLLSEADMEKTYHDLVHGVLGCKHYQRAAKLQAHCCGKWFTCRFCHDDVSDHTITRNLTTTMMCMECSHVQPAGQVCVNPACGVKVAKYYCEVCKLWDNDPVKNIYHCHECGICRIGKGLGNDYFHCKKCNVCMAISLKGQHKCIERNLESDCPICGEYMFTSTTTVIFMPCGHCIHLKCHQEYIQTSYQCPTCSKSLANMTEYFRRIDLMLAQHRMPEEYANMQSSIYCNDCEKKSVAKYHFLYHKCQHCRGYNTKVLKTSDLGEVMRRSPAPAAGAADGRPDPAEEGEAADATSPPSEGMLASFSSSSSSSSAIGSTASTDFQSLPSEGRSSFSSLDLDAARDQHNH